MLTSLLPKENIIHIYLHTHYITDIFNIKNRSWIPFTTFFQFHFLETFSTLLNHLRQNSVIILFRYFVPPPPSTLLLKTTCYNFLTVPGPCIILMNQCTAS